MESLLRHKGKFPIDRPLFYTDRHDYIIVLLEDVSYHPENGYKLLLDFYTFSDYASFLRVYGEDGNLRLLNEGGNYVELPRTTFFCIENYRTNDKLEKGKHYYLGLRELRERQERYETNNSELFPTLFSIKLKQDQSLEGFENDPLLYYIGSLTYPQWVFSSLHAVYSTMQIPEKSKVELAVWDVGQGNYNEIRVDNKPYLFYDAGTDLDLGIVPFNLYKKKLTDELDKSNLPIFVLSHWDIDHFSLLFSLSNQYLRKLDYCIFPSYVKSLSVFSFITRLNMIDRRISMVVLPHQIAWTKHMLNTNLTLYANKYVKSSTNNSGLSLFVTGPKNNALLPGDCRYKLAEGHANDSIYTAMGPDQKHILVIPHHGGLAGKVSYQINNGCIVEGIVSVGKKNRYGHPFPGVLKQIQTFVKTVKMTKDLGDIIETL